MRKNRKECKEDRATCEKGSGEVPLRKWHVGRLAAAVERMGKKDSRAALAKDVYAMCERMYVGGAGQSLAGVMSDMRYDVLAILRGEGVELEELVRPAGLREDVRWARIAAAAARCVEGRLETALEGLTADLARWVTDMKGGLAGMRTEGEKGLAGFQRDDWTALMRKKGLRWRMDRTTTTRDKRGYRVGPGSKARDSVYERGNIALSWTADEVLLKDTDGHEVALGDFRVVLTVERRGEGVYVRATAEPAGDNEERGGYWHPHVSSDNRVCLGDAETDVTGAVKMGMLGRAIELVEGVLRTYNQDSPYKELWRWREDEDAGVDRCVTCDGEVLEDEGNSCDDCEGVVCGACIRSCVCGRLSLCSSCEERGEVQHCTSCGYLLCGGCVRICEGCSEPMCCDCDDNGMCASCAEEREDEADAEDDDEEVDGAEQEAQDGAQVVEEGPMPPGITGPAEVTGLAGYVCCVCGAESLPGDVCVDCGRRFCGADLYMVPAAAIRGGVPEVVGAVRQWMCEECRGSWVGGGRTQRQDAGVCAGVISPFREAVERARAAAEMGRNGRPNV
jgi:hypothetical protein